MDDEIEFVQALALPGTTKDKVSLYYFKLHKNKTKIFYECQKGYKERKIVPDGEP